MEFLLNLCPKISMGYSLKNEESPVECTFPFSTITILYLFLFFLWDLLLFLLWPNDFTWNFTENIEANRKELLYFPHHQICQSTSLCIVPSAFSLSKCSVHPFVYKSSSLDKGFKFSASLLNAGGALELSLWPSSPFTLVTYTFSLGNGTYHCGFKYHHHVADSKVLPLTLASPLN